MASSDQDAISLQVSLPQMLDLALGTPEVGAFNFNLLHNFLHVVLHQIDLKNTKVEYRGDNANRIKTMVSSLKSGPSIALHEYSITDGSGNIFQRGENAEGLSSPVDIVAADKNNGLRMSKGTKQQVGPGAGTALESIIYVEPVLDGATPTGLAFKDLDDSVKRLQQQFQALEELATTPEMVERLKTSRTDPLSDMWHVININKRLDATEQGINKGLSEQIELLKTVKADKEELQGALADKADAHTVNNKVSCDKFDTTCEDLTRCLDNTIAKLTHQEYIWQEALDSVQQEVEGKLDKIEISPIKEFVNTRLKLLQDKLKILFDKRRETEAAGTRKILTDVQCISCDKKTMMKVTESINYRSDPMPCSRAIKPYLIYELNQVKKQHKKVPSRTAIQFSPASPKRSKFDQMDKPSRDQICTRYCGGSHTITSPHQRIMRMGHFLAQWGPEAIQLGEGVVQGSDGQLYKSRPMPSGAVSRKPDPCDPCTCNETEVKKTSPVSRQSSDVTAAAPPKTSQISQNKTVSTTQATSRRQSIKKTANSSKGLHSTQSLQREPKSSSNVSPTSLTIKQEKSEEKFTPSPPISPQRTSITISKINEEEENDDESIEENYE
ncbi:hypothetical protein HCN44_009201 [Aphidius gifuensis]|uniref:DUF4795 domain-containing protein n=1 Tax=Aphidius gifuensis TaxID=684658 RepID=A0A835CXV2_APHGI|nr:hypothetical protein HCN44_009201 [Aphidius gifuensis]